MRRVESECRSAETYNEALSEAKPGDNVGFNVRNVTVKDIWRGYVASDAKNKPTTCCENLTVPVIMARRDQIRKGYTPVLDCHTSHKACKVDKLLWKLDWRTGKELDVEPEFIKNDGFAHVLVVLTKPLFPETFIEETSL